MTAQADHADVIVLWQDAYAAAVLKPSGMLSHNSTFAGPRERALLQAARDALGRQIWLVHRLDRGTSGVMLVVFDPSTVRDFSSALSEATKRYVAITRGRMKGDHTVSIPLKDEQGVSRDALTHVAPIALSEVERVTLVRCRLETGRMHQARRHLNRLSHPVVNDANHGDTRFNRAFRERWGVRRLLLHAESITLTHPISEQRLTVEAPLPASFVDVIRDLFGDQEGGTSQPSGRGASSD